MIYKYTIEKYKAFTRPSNQEIYKDFDSAKKEYDRFNERKNGGGFIDLNRYTFDDDGKFIAHDRLLSKSI